MKRRAFVTLLGGAAVAWPLAARAQQSAKVPRVGILSPAASETAATLTAFREAIRDLGYIEGQTIALDFRLSKGIMDALPALAAELVRIPVNVIVTESTSGTLAAFDATRTIPIVMATTGGDPIALGLAKSLSRPGGNVTGTNFLAGLSEKRLQLLKQAFPGVQRVAVLANPKDAISVSEMPKAEMAAGRHQPLKFLCSHPRVPDDGRDRAVDGGRQEIEPLRPSGRDYDPDRLPPRLAGVRVVRSAMVAGRADHRPATRPQGEERLAECPPHAGRRDTRAAASAARTGGILARLYDRAGRADDAQGVPCAIRSDRGSGQNAIPDTSAHAAAWLRLCPSQRRPRHTGATGLARAQEHPAHSALHRVGS